MTGIIRLVTGRSPTRSVDSSVVDWIDSNKRSTEHHGPIPRNKRLNRTQTRPICSNPSDSPHSCFGEQVQPSNVGMEPMPSRPWVGESELVFGRWRSSFCFREDTFRRGTVAVGFVGSSRPQCVRTGYKTRISVAQERRVGQPTHSRWLPVPGLRLQGPRGLQRGEKHRIRSPSHPDWWRGDAPVVGRTNCATMTVSGDALPDEESGRTEVRAKGSTCSTAD